MFKHMCTHTSAGNKIEFSDQIGLTHVLLSLSCSLSDAHGGRQQAREVVLECMSSCIIQH